MHFGQFIRAVMSLIPGLIGFDIRLIRGSPCLPLIPRQLKLMTIASNPLERLIECGVQRLESQPRRCITRHLV